MKNWIKKALCGVALGVSAIGFSACTPEDLETIQFRYDEGTGYVQYLVNSKDDWTNVISKEQLMEYLGDDLKGDAGVNGREVEFRKNSTHIQWRYVGDNNDWENLVSLSEIKGDPGSEGSKGDDGKSAYEIYKQYKGYYTKTESEWLNDLINGNLTPVSNVYGDADGDGKITMRDQYWVSNIANESIDQKSKEAIVTINIDTNMDGVIDKADCYKMRTMIMYYIATYYPELITISHNFGDVNLDGVIDENDYTLLVETISGGNIYNQLNCEQAVLSSLIDHHTIDELDAEVLRAYLDGKLSSLDGDYSYVSFDLQGMNLTAIDSQIIERNESINLPQLSAPDGYEFLGWYVGDEKIESATYTAVAGRNYVEIKAHWSDTTTISQGLVIEDGVVKGLGTCVDTNLIIPNYYNGSPVTQIDFADVNLNSLNTTITSIQISKFISEIELRYFQKIENIVVDSDNNYYKNSSDNKGLIRRSDNYLIYACDNYVPDESVLGADKACWSDRDYQKITLTSNILDSNDFDKLIFHNTNIDILVLNDSSNDDYSILLTILSMEASVNTIICDNELVASGDVILEDVNSPECDILNQVKIYVKEGLNFNTDWWIGFKAVTEGDGLLDGYVLYQKLGE